ncbi:MAG: hypothetical protein L0H19_02990 [Salinisphaera sp.]|nr:hypothetical protein [Salinisphaera sp.]
MNNQAKVKGRWIHRFGIWLFTAALAVLVYWVLGFIVGDIRTVRGPDYEAIEAKYVDDALLARAAALDEQIRVLGQQINDKQDRQRVLGDSSRNLQQTINQLIELRKLGIQKGVASSAAEQANFTRSLNRFLGNQKQYQQLSKTVSKLLATKQQLVRERRQVERQIAQQQQPARAAFERLSREHRLHLALWQLAVLLPILVIAAFIAIAKRGSIYFPLYLAVAGATLVKVTLVVHQYFPTRYFKYILVIVLLIVVARLLIHFIRTIAFPQTQWLVKQYREAYERFLCPVCEYPIRIGPRRYLFWTRRTVNRIVVPGEHGDTEQVYTCPACGEQLFEECGSCRKVRHTMLPNCMHCGAQKEIQ